MLKVKIGVLVSGSGSNLQSIIDSIEAGIINGKIEAVISNNKDAYGLERARKHNIEAVYVNQNDFSSYEDYNDAIIDELQKRGVELVVLAGYIKILTNKFIETFNNKIINIHPSLIPSFCGKGYYGLRVHQAAIDYGVKLSGATVHFVNEEADNGPIIFQEAVSVHYDDTPEILQERILEAEHRLLPLAVKFYCEKRLEVVGRKVNIL